MLTVLAPAKLNLSLDIVGIRADGYHLLRSIMKTITLYDTIQLEKADTISLLCNQQEILNGPENLAYRAAVAFAKKMGDSVGASIVLEKQIPFGAGLGGGSSDAAAVLMGLNQLYEAHLSIEELSSCAITLGADVPFFLLGGTALVEGIGEQYTKLPDFMPCWFVVIKPEIGISTPEAYRQFDLLKSVEHPNTDVLIDAITQQDIVSFCQNTGNVLECAVDKPEIVFYKKQLLNLGADFAAMTGSGSAVYGIFTSQEMAKEALSSLQQEGVTAFLCQ